MPAAAVAKKATKQKFTIDVSVPANDKVLSPADFSKYLQEHIKVAKKTNNLGDAVKVEVSGNTITISASNVSFAKRYFKFLAKRYLKKNSLREYMRVLATSKTGYSLKYYSIGEEEETE